MTYITVEESTNLSEADYKEWKTYLNEAITQVKGTKRDKFIKSIDPIITSEVRNQIWEYNHINICAEISNQMQEYNRMPSVKAIAEKTDLSRQTVNKHIKEYNLSGINEELERFKFMMPKVLAKVFKFAVNGDVRAAKLYFDVLSNTQSIQIKNQQNYFITINGIQVTEEAIQKLPFEQLQQLQQILKSATTPIHIQDQTDEHIEK